MADLQAFSVVQNGAMNINQCPRYVITGQYEQSNPTTGMIEIIADFTGANALDFPNVLKTLTLEQINFLVNKWSPDLLAIKAGLLTSS